MANFNFKDYLSAKKVYPIVKKFYDGVGFWVGTGEGTPLNQTDTQKEVRINQDGSKDIMCEYIRGGLKIEVNYHYFPEGDRFSRSGTITNHTSQPVPHLYRIVPFSHKLNIKRQERLRIHSFKGGRESLAYPPVSFRHDETELVSWMANYHSSAEFNGGLKGRSTDRDMPYFVTQVGEEGGVFFALEWPGDWNCSIRRESGGEKVVFAMGLSFLDLDLLPGESIPLPGCLCGFYRGDWVEGANTLKDTITRYYLPRLAGKEISPPVFYNSWFGLLLDCGEKRLMEVSKDAAGIGCEYFVLDTGWHAGCGMTGEAYQEGLGNWKFPHPEKYPNGLKPLSDFVRNQGMKFGLWIEPERCDRNSWLYENHPEWVIPDPKGGLQNLVDLGNPEAVTWFKDTIDEIFEKNNVEWTRIDSGIDPAYNWESRDVPGRKGISQIRHFEGLFDFLDHLLKKHKTLLIEGCAAGGRRMDLACLKRSHTYWCNDHTSHPDIIRWDMGTNFILPANYLNHVIVPTNNVPYPDYVYHCFFGGGLGFSEDLTAWGKGKIRAAQRHAKVFKEIRHILMKDFNALFGRPDSLEDWDGWQWHDKEKEEGVVIFFRVLSPDATKTAKLRWVKRSKEYQFFNPYSRKKKTISGKILLSKGFQVRLPLRGSVLLKYKTVG